MKKVRKMDAAQLSQLDLSKRLRELMLAHDLTVAELATVGGVSKSAMEKYLAGPSSPRAVTLANICMALRVSPSWLLLGVAENDEIAEAVAFTTNARTAFAKALLKIRSDEELMAAFQSDPTSGDAWSIFRNDIPYHAGKIAYAGFREEKDSMTVGPSVEIKRKQK